MTTTVSPVGAGTVSVVSDGDHGEALGSFSIFTATPETGYKFDHWEFDVVESYQEYYEASPTVYNSKLSDYSNPTTRRVAGGYNRPDYWGTGKWSRYSYEMTSATAYFIPSSDPDPQPPQTTTVTVSFDANLTGAVVSPTSREYQSATSTTTYGTLPTPYSSVDATFVGWFTAASGGTQVTASDTLVSLSDHTLYAQWKYTITATAYWQGKVAINGGTQGAQVSGLFDIGETITLTGAPNDPRLYYFDHWFLGDDWTSEIGRQGPGTPYQVQVTGSARYGALFMYYPLTTVIAIAEYSGATVSIDGGTADEYVEKSVRTGTTVTLTASETANFDFERFVRWADYGDDGDAGANVSTDRTFQYTTSASDNGVRKFIAVYSTAWTQILVAVDPQGAGTASVLTPPDSGSDWYNNGTQVSISASAASGYRFVKWTYYNRSSSQLLSTDAQYTFSAGVFSPFRYITITAHFVELKAFVTFKTYYKNQEIQRTITIPSTANSAEIGTLPDAPTYVNTTLVKTRTFLGWFTEEFGGTQITASYEVEAGQTYTFHAHWQRIIVAVVRSPTCGWLLLTGVATQSGSLAISPVDTQSPAETSSAPANTVTCEGGLYGSGRIDGLRVTASNETGVTASAVVTDYTVGQLTNGVSFPPSHDDLRLFLRSYSLKLLRDPTTNLPLRDQTSGNILADA